MDGCFYFGHLLEVFMGPKLWPDPKWTHGSPTQFKTKTDECQNYSETDRRIMRCDPQCEIRAHTATQVLHIGLLTPRPQTHSSRMGPYLEPEYNLDMVQQGSWVGSQGNVVFSLVVLLVPATYAFHPTYNISCPA